MKACIWHQDSETSPSIPSNAQQGHSWEMVQDPEGSAFKMSQSLTNAVPVMREIWISTGSLNAIHLVL